MCATGRVSTCMLTHMETRGHCSVPLTVTLSPPNPECSVCGVYMDPTKARNCFQAFSFMALHIIFETRSPTEPGTHHLDGLIGQ